MNVRSILRGALLVASFAGLAAFATPVPQASASHSQQKPDAARAASQAASGKIGAVASDGFTLEVSQGASTQTVRFVTDSGTKVKGTLRAGSTASVEFYTDNNGRNVATTVVVESNG